MDAFLAGMHGVWMKQHRCHIKICCKVKHRTERQKDIQRQTNREVHGVLTCGKDKDKGQRPKREKEKK
jgi:hypothetical protein